MTRKDFELIGGGRLPADIRRSIHTQLFRLGQTPREVARRYGLKDVEALAVARAVETADDDRRLREAFAAGRRSLLTPPPWVASRRAA